MKRSNLSVWFGLALVASLLSLSGGCAGYKLGSNLPPGVTSINIPIFVNEAKEPGLETILTSATIKEFQKDGSLRVLPKDQADSVLEVTIRKYELEPLRYRKDQSVTAQEYRLNLTADVILRKRASKEIMVNSHGVVGFATFTALADLPSARRTALPKAAEDLGQRIVKCVVEYW